MKKNSERQCAVTRERGAEGQLIRFVLSPDGRVTPDLHRRLPGRGVWVKAQRHRIARAISGKAFARSFRQPALADASLVDDVDRLLRQAALQSLSLANKAGLASSGFGKVEAMARAGEAICLIHAAEAAQDGRRKLAAALGSGLGMAAVDAVMQVPVISTFTGAEIGGAVGRADCTHMALRSGGAAQKFIVAARRVENYDSGGEIARRTGQDGV